MAPYRLVDMCSTIFSCRFLIVVIRKHDVFCFLESGLFHISSATSCFPNRAKNITFDVLSHLPATVPAI